MCKSSEDCIWIWRHFDWLTHIAMSLYAHTLIRWRTAFRRTSRWLYILSEVCVTSFFYCRRPQNRLLLYLYLTFRSRTLACVTLSSVYICKFLFFLFALLPDFDLRSLSLCSLCIFFMRLRFNTDVAKALQFGFLLLFLCCLSSLSVFIFTILGLGMHPCKV